MDVGNNGLGVGNTALKLRNYDMGVGNNSACVCDIVVDVGKDGLGI